MKKRLVVILLLVLVLVAAVVAGFYLLYPIPSQRSFTLAESKENGVFIAQYALQNSPIVLSPLPPLPAKDIWVETTSIQGSEAYSLVIELDPSYGKTISDYASSGITIHGALPGLADYSTGRQEIF